MKFPESYRAQFPSRYISNPGDGFGVFVVPASKAPRRRGLRIIACDGLDTGWDHVSVSVDNCRTQTPVWDEMCFVKNLFWESDEWVVQFHPAEKDYVNHHPGVLHLWHPIKEKLPVPPKVCV